MEKRKKWQLFLILSVVVLTVYNILPTFFYYTKPLKSPISESQAREIARGSSLRVAHLKQEAEDWVRSFCQTVHIHPQNIERVGQNLKVSFAKTEEAATLRKFLPRAGSLISFIPAQLGLAQQEHPKEVMIQRRIPLELDVKDFVYASNGSDLYRDWVIDRAAQIAYVLAGPSEWALSLGALDPSKLEPLAF